MARRGSGGVVVTWSAGDTNAAGLDSGRLHNFLSLGKTVYFSLPSASDSLRFCLSWCLCHEGRKRTILVGKLTDIGSSFFCPTPWEAGGYE